MIDSWVNKYQPKQKQTRYLRVKNGKTIRIDFLSVHYMVVATLHTQNSIELCFQHPW